MTAVTLQLKSERQLLTREIELTAHGLKPGARVELSASLTDAAGLLWRSAAEFVVGDNGVVDPAHQAPVGGSYRGLDSQGLIWSMAPSVTADELYASDVASHRMGKPHLPDMTTCEILFEATLGGLRCADATLIRELVPSTVSVTEIEGGQIKGQLCVPNEGNPEGQRRPGIILIGGSDGGTLMTLPSARCLAAEGYNVMTLAYWGYPGRPRNLHQMPVEYFQDAISWFKHWLGHDQVAFQGASRGGEGTLLAATYFGDELKGAVSVAPGHVAMGAFGPDDPQGSAWTYQGEELPWAGTAEDQQLVSPEAMKMMQNPPPGVPLSFTDFMGPYMTDPAVQARAAIPVEKVKCPLLLVSGGDDQMWPAAYCANAVMNRLQQHGHRLPYEHACYGGAGHSLSLWGGPTSMSSAMRHPVVPLLCAIGGTPESNGRSQRQAWHRMLAFYADIFSA